MCENKLFSNRQLRRKINNAVQNIFLPSYTNDSNFTSTNTQNLNSSICYAVENNKSIDTINTVDTVDTVDINESPPILNLIELNSNNMDDIYILDTDDSDSSTVENNENHNDNGLITHTFQINPANFTNNLCKIAIDNNLTHAALNMILELINPAYQFLSRTAKNLLRTSRKKLETIYFDNGEMYYYGIQKCLMRKLQNGGINGEILTIKLIINIDGLLVYTRAVELTCGLF